MTQSTPQKVWLDRATYDKLQAELAELKGPRRQEVIARIAASRDEGDLKENGGYHAAREEQGRLEGRILELEEKLRNAEIGETPKDDGVVEPGMKVTYKFVGDEDEEAETFLLGSREIEAEDITVYSPQSPLGSAINGHKKGETVAYEAPNGKTLEVVILDAVPYTGT